MHRSFIGQITINAHSRAALENAGTPIALSGPHEEARGGQKKETSNALQLGHSVFKRAFPSLFDRATGGPVNRTEAPK